MARRSSKRGPRHKYSEDTVAYMILNDRRLYKICEIVFSANDLVHASYVARKLKISIGYAYNLMRKLEKWGVLRAVKDPVNGKLAFRAGTSKVAELVAEEIRKRKAEETEQALIQHATIEL